MGRVQGRTARSTQATRPQSLHKADRVSAILSSSQAGFIHSLQESGQRAVRTRQCPANMLRELVGQPGERLRHQPPPPQGPGSPLQPCGEHGLGRLCQRRSPHAKPPATVPKCTQPAAPGAQGLRRVTSAPPGGGLWGKPGQPGGTAGSWAKLHHRPCPHLSARLACPHLARDLPSPSRALTPCPEPSLCHGAGQSGVETEAAGQRGTPWKSLIARRAMGRAATEGRQQQPPAIARAAGPLLPGTLYATQQCQRDTQEEGRPGQALGIQ